MTLQPLRGHWTMTKLLGLLALILMPVSVSAQEPTTPTLRGLAAQRGFLIGAAVQVEKLQSDPDYAALVSRQFNILTAENDMKFNAIQPRRGEFNWDRTDFLIDFCEKNGMTVHGHTLVWREAVPNWIGDGSSFGREEMIEIMRAHIQTTVGRYKGRIAIWDVVNEAFLPRETATDGYDPGHPWLRAIGKDYLAIAFRIAHAADPEAILAYNDFDIEAINDKSDLVYRRLKELLDQGVPVHALGIQFHREIDFALDAEKLESFEQNMQRFADLGLKLYITELDLPTGGENTPAMFARQALSYANILDACLRQPACQALQVWGVSDRSSWLSRYVEPKGVDKAPLLFDRDLAPKPACEAMLDVLRQADTSGQ